MKRTRHFYLPEGVVMEIMSWLPPKCIIRFKCVCKLWCELINVLLKNPTFVTKHLHHANNNVLSPTSFVFGRTIPWKRFRCTHLPKCDQLCLSDDFFVRLDPFISIDQFRYTRAKFGLPLYGWTDSIYHCDGIICVACTTVDHVSLCNPALHEYRLLPTSCVPFIFFWPMGIGFGYDYRAKDYKVVRFGFEISEDDLVTRTNRAEIYSLANDSWREIEINTEIGDFWGNYEVFCEGICYWPWSGSNRKMILSFDLYYEKFFWIPMPNTRYEINKKNFRLSVWNESIALFFHPNSNDSDDISRPPIEIWVLHNSYGGDNGSSSSWIKHMTIGPLECIPTALAFWKSNEILMVTTDNELVSYNICKQKLTSLEILQFNNLENELNYVCLYVESLVSVGCSKDNLEIK